jgi:hypothetical protein
MMCLTLLLSSCAGLSVKDIKPGDQVIDRYYPNSIMTVETVRGQFEGGGPKQTIYSDYVCGSVTGGMVSPYTCWSVKNVEAL